MVVEVVVVVVVVGAAIGRKPDPYLQQEAATGTATAAAVPANTGCCA
jgi:hypothetical protein